MAQTGVVLRSGEEGSLPDLLLIGRGDATIGAGQDCQQRCLDELAKGVSDAGITELADIIADDTWFTDERWNVGWSWEDLQERYGTATSALIANNNEVQIEVRPGAGAGDRAIVGAPNFTGIFSVRNDVDTVSDETWLRYERLPGGRILRIYGRINDQSDSIVLRLGIDDPAEFSALHLHRALLENGVSVKGRVKLNRRARPPQGAKGMFGNNQCQTAESVEYIAALPSPDWDAMLTQINKRSQNLYSEVMLRQLGRICGDGSVTEGLKKVVLLLDEAGIPRTGYDVFDGSGMSVYNRISPRALLLLLLFADRQEWGDDWRDTFPVGGVDGSLGHRFTNTPLDGKIFAKTGTMKGVNALSGYMIAASGEMLAFSIIANDRPLSLKSAVPMMDQALLDIAERF